MQPYAHDEAAISAPGLAKRAAWAGSIAAVRQMPTGPMLRCILLAAAAGHAAHAFPTNDAERTAFAYLINGTEPADGLLEVDAAAAASAHVGCSQTAATRGPTPRCVRTARAGRACPTPPRRSSTTPLCGEIHGATRATAACMSGTAAPGLAGVTLNYVPWSNATTCSAARVPQRGAEAAAADGGAYGAAGIRVMAARSASRTAAARTPARYARLLRRPDPRRQIGAADIRGTREA